MKNKVQLSFLWKGLFGLSALYSLFSYSLTDPNLVLISFGPYWQFQQWMWRHFFGNPFLLTAAYLALIAGFCAFYLWGLALLKTANQKLSLREARNMFLTSLLALSPLLLSYNALSHDVFNYMFNAKMVLIYQANPHIRVALDFMRDNWTRFMHNTHTPAPYGYGWTALSLIPYAFGLSKFFPTWLLFRGFAVVSVGLLFWVYAKLAKTLTAHTFWLVFLNPLFFLEIVSNQHNDLWMMVPAIASLWLIGQTNKRPQWKGIALSALLLSASISIKLGTAVLIPVWLWLVGRNYAPAFKKWLSWKNVALVSSLLLFAPLFTLRSQQFLPWYLLWSFVWLPSIQNHWWKKWLIVFSMTSLLRYLPWLWAGGFTDEVLAQQKWLVWGGGLSVWLLWLGWSHFWSMRYNNR